MYKIWSFVSWTIWHLYKVNDWNTAKFVVGPSFFLKKLTSSWIMNVVLQYFILFCFVSLFGLLLSVVLCHSRQVQGQWPSGGKIPTDHKARIAKYMVTQSILYLRKLLLSGHSFQILVNKISPHISSQKWGPCERLWEDTWCRGCHWPLTWGLTEFTIYYFFSELPHVTPCLLYGTRYFPWNGMFWLA